MAKLSDRQLAALLDEIAAAIRVDMPIADAMQRLRDRRLGPVAIAAGVCADAMNRGQTAADALRLCNSPIIDQAAAAVQASQQSGDPKVMTRLSSLLRRRAEYFRSSQLAWLYPLILLVIAYAIALGVMVPMLRTYQGRDFTWSESVLNFSHWLESNWFVPPIALAIMVIGWLIWRSRNRSLPRDARLRLFCQSLVDQIAADVPESDAIRNAAKLSGEASVLAETNPTFKSPQFMALLAKVQSPLMEVPGVSEEATLVARLKFLAAIHDERARRHDYLWSRLIPRIAMVVVGGGFTLAYAWWVIAPVYQQVAQW